MVGIQDILQLAGNLPSLFSFMERLFFVTICLFLGNFSWKGWKRYKNWGITFIASLLLGLGVLASAILLAEAIPVRTPFVPYAVQAFIAAIIFYAILRLLSGDAKKVSDLVKGETFKKLRREFNNLREEYHRLLKLLERKKIIPKPLSAGELDESLAEILGKKGHDEFSINTRSTLKDTRKYELKIKEDVYEAVLDTYTAELLKFKKLSLSFGERLKKGFKGLTSNKRVLAGAVLLIVFIVFVIILISPDSVSEIQSTLDLTPDALNLTQGGLADNFTNYSVTNTSCLSVTDALYLAYVNDTLDSQEMIPSQALNELQSNYPDDNFSGGSRVAYEGSDYLLITSRLMSEEDFNLALQTYVQQNLMNLLQANVDFCSITYKGRSISYYTRLCTVRLSDNEVCECRLLSEVSEYCFVFSEQLSAQLSEQLSGLQEQLGGLTEQAGGLEGLLEVIK
ncbi:hypothetical protein GF352_04340 [archaeon]|nr:hypothetical protein [archaeon]